MASRGQNRVIPRTNRGHFQWQRVRAEGAGKGRGQMVWANGAVRRRSQTCLAV